MAVTHHLADWPAIPLGEVRRTHRAKAHQTTTFQPRRCAGRRIVEDDDTTTPAATTVSMSVGPVIVTIETSLGLTPEMMEDVLIRARRQVVAAAHELGLVVEVLPAEDAAKP